MINEKFKEAVHEDIAGLPLVEKVAYLILLVIVLFLAGWSKPLHEPWPWEVDKEDSPR